jgi:hypothetical protein
VRLVQQEHLHKDLRDLVVHQQQDYPVQKVMQPKVQEVQQAQKVLVEHKVIKDLQLRRVSKVSKDQPPLQESLVTKDPQETKVLKEI